MKLKNLISLLIILIGVNSSIIIFYLLIDNIAFLIFSIFFLNSLSLIFWYMRIVLAQLKLCKVCNGKAKCYLSNTRWDDRGRRVVVISYCFSHFLEAYRAKLTRFPGTLIFLKNDKYFVGYIYLDLEDLRIHPAHYSEAEILQISQLLDSLGTHCDRCHVNPAKILLMDARVIGFSVRAPLIKEETYLEFNESVCVDCFLRFLSRELEERQKEFDMFRINLPYRRKGIYLFEQ
ncbi:MAG: hypothetical protein ACTSRL_19440 [Candidatus Helarchaeota archaeon]